MSALQGLGCGDLLKRPEQAHFPGSMNFSYLIHSEGGASFFVKINCNAGAHEMFEGEKLSLEYLSSASEVRHSWIHRLWSSIHCLLSSIHCLSRLPPMVLDS
jgi:hypothetical protein